ncbi:ABC transporter F family member 4 [Anarrhichthys ocellatus]|uniref:ABC transporter F family member 4 n=1 Tax=Anarrhichthys ocellatus TaxID=433405 RepID=UPI0012ED5F49|nr:ABC transporter F family member 4-like [Anarrhichthys ocellatus]
MSRAMLLQQRWQELKERELTAQQNNRQMLQQFEEAQDTLKEMLTLTAAMKTIRMEYKRYLEESCPRWQQQLKEKTQAAQRKRMEEYLRSCLKNTEERETASSTDQPFLSQGSTTMNQNIVAPPRHYSPNSHLAYNQDGSPYLPYPQSSRQTRLQSQTARCPIRAPYQPQGSSHVPLSFLPPHIFPQLHHLTSSPGDRQPRPRLNPPGWAAMQPDQPWSWAAGAAGILSGTEALWGQLYPEEPPPEMGIAQVVGEETDTSRASSSKRERGGGGRSSRLSPELDIKPVRLSGGLAESSESSREPSQVSREKRKKREERGRSHCSFSASQSCSSQESSSAIVIAAVKVVQSSESDASEKGRTSTRRTRRSGGLAVGSPRDEKVVKGSKGDDPVSHKEESQSTSEELGGRIEEFRSENAENQNPDDKSESCGEESGSQKEETGSVSIKIETGGGDEVEKQESSSSERSNVGEKNEEDLDGEDGDAEEKENSQTDEEQEESDGEEDHEASERKSAKEEDEETGADEQDSEDESDGEDNMEDEESDEEEQRGDLAGEPEEEKDSDDSIISPQDKSKKMHIIPEEASEEEEEEESKTGSSDDDSNEISDEDDVENLLAPQKQSQKKEEKDLKADEQPKAICDTVEIFQVEPDKSTKSDHPSDSDEFDHFYG